VTSAAYGHSVQAIVALGYVTTENAALDPGFLRANFEIDIRGRSRAGAGKPEAPYDPASANVKA